MKKIILILGVVCTTAFGTIAQTSAPAKTAPAKKTTKTTTPAATPAQPQVQGPMITFDNTTHDYGTVNKGADGNCVFKFKNTGNEPLVILDAHASCGCTVPTYSTEPVMPGKEGSIPVRYNNMHIVGSFNKSSPVRSNSANNSTVIFTIKGNVVESAQ